MVVHIIKLPLFQIQSYWMTLNHKKNIWKQFMGESWKKWMNCGCKLQVRKPFLPLIIKGKPLILMLPKFMPKMLFFLASWWYWISWLDNYIFLFARLWFCEDIHHSSILKLAIEKSNSEIYKCKFIKQVDSRWFKLWTKSVSWVCVFTQKGHLVDILPYS